MNAQQKRAIQIAVGMCRDRLVLPKKGALDYDQAALQLSELPDAAEIRERVQWVLDYEREEGRSSAAPPAP